jgi:hypothetical protein
MLTIRAKNPNSTKKTEEKYRQFMEPEGSLPHSQGRTTLIPILNQVNPVHTTLSYLFKIHFNIIHPSISWSSLWSFWYSVLLVVE